MDKIIIDGTEYNLNHIFETEKFNMSISGYNNSETPILSFKDKMYIGKAISKEVPKPDYEILQCVMPDDHPHQYINRCLTKEDPCKIYSVKRLSDMSVWNIGSDTQYGKINKFSIHNPYYDFLSVECDLGNCYLKDIKQPKRIPLFYADNGLTPIYENDEYWWLYGNDILSNIASKYSNCDKDDRKYFSTRQLAEDELLMNAPGLSLNDLLSVWSVGEMYTSPLFLKFKELAKSKLKL